MKRIFIDIALVVFLLPLLYFKVYELVPPPLQLVFFKALIVSMAIIHAHIAGKLLFGTVDWKGELRVHHIVRIVFYAIVPICYSIGG